MPDPLTTFLDAFPARDQPVERPEPLGSGGGLSGSLFWRYRAAAGARVAHAWPVGAMTSERLLKIQAWMRQLEPLGFVPTVFADRDGRTFQEHGGRLWELLSWMTGGASSGVQIGAERLTAAFRALGAVHRTLEREAREDCARGLDRRRRELAGLLSGGFERLEAAVRSHSADPAAGPSLKHLGLARSLGPSLIGGLERKTGRIVAVQPCLRDVRPEHFLFTGERVTGLVDYGAMDMDSVACDLARLLAGWRLDDPGRRSAALESYASIRPLTPAEMELLPAYEATQAVLGGVRWVAWRFVEHRAFSDEQVIGGLDRAWDRLGTWTGRLLEG